MATILLNKLKPKGTAVTNVKVGSIEVKYVKRGDGKIFYDTQADTTYDTPSISLSYSTTVAAKGGTASPTLSYSQTWRKVGHSGATYEQTAIKSNATISYSISGTGATINSSTGVVTWASLGTSFSNGRSATVTVSVTMNGKKSTKTATVSQALNRIVSVTANSNLFSYAIIGAGATSATPSSSHSPIYTFSSTETTTTTPSSTYGSISALVSYSLAQSQNGFTAINASTGVLTATSRGTNYGSSTRSSATVTKTLVYTWKHSSTYGGGSVSSGNLTKTATCTQGINVIKSMSWYSVSAGTLTNPATYSAAGATQSVANKTAASAVPLLTFSSDATTTSYSTYATVSVTYVWASNKSYATLTSANTSSLNVTMPDRATTTGDARTATITRQASFTASLKDGYINALSITTSASVTATVTQQANVAKASSAITAYGTPSIIIGDGITAAGGSASIVALVYNTRTYYYTSGDVSGTTSEVGTVTLKEQSDNNNRFSLSGTTLSHSSMTTNATTDTCTIRAINAGSTSKYKDDSVSVTNSYSDSGGAVTYGAWGGGAISFSSTSALSAGADSRTVTIQPWVRDKNTSAVIRTYTSGSTQTITAASTVNDYYGGTVTMSENGGYTSLSAASYTASSSAKTLTLTKSTCGTTMLNSTTVTVTAKGATTTTKGITQAANLVTAVSVNANTFSYANISAGATSATPSTSHSPKFTFTSGSTSTTTPGSTYGTLTTSASYSLAKSQNGFTAVNASTGVLTATSRGTTYGDSTRSSASVTKTLVYTWKHSSSYGSGSVGSGNLTKTGSCVQAANIITGVYFDSTQTSAGAITAPSNFAAAGATQTVSNATSASCLCRVVFSSTSSYGISASNTYVTLTTTYSWTSEKPSIAVISSANTASLAVTMGMNASTSSRSAVITRKVTFSASVKSGYSNALSNSTTAETTATVTQNAATWGNMTVVRYLSNGFALGYVDNGSYAGGDKSRPFRNIVVASFVPVSEAKVANVKLTYTYYTGVSTTSTNSVTVTNRTIAAGQTATINGDTYYGIIIGGGERVSFTSSNVTTFTVT